jgi:hypothetical protein
MIQPNKARNYKGIKSFNSTKNGSFDIIKNGYIGNAGGTSHSTRIQTEVALPSVQLEVFRYIK